MYYYLVPFITVSFLCGEYVRVVYVFLPDGVFLPFCGHELDFDINSSNIMGEVIKSTIHSFKAPTRA